MSVAAAKANRTNSISQQLPIMISNNFNKAHFVVRNSMLKPENGNHVQKKRLENFAKKNINTMEGKLRREPVRCHVNQC